MTLNVSLLFIFLLGGPCELPLTGDLWDWEQKQPRNQGFTDIHTVHKPQCCKCSAVFDLNGALFIFFSFQPSDDENSDNSNECVVCLSDLRDTLILPCRHLCLCNSCADTLRYQANNCPICRLRKEHCFILIQSLKKVMLAFSMMCIVTCCCTTQPSGPCCRSELWGKSLELFLLCPSALFWLRLWIMTSTL